MTHDTEPAGDAKRLAVALKYDRAQDGAPRVVASGKGALADKIREVAAERDIVVREDADLAQLLSLVSVGNEIPSEAFVAVAEVLTYVYRLNGALRDGRGS